MRYPRIIIIHLAAVLALGCSGDTDQDPVIPKGDYEKGYFVTNEGPFQNGTGTITFIGEEGTVQQAAYKKANGEDLGNIVNAMFVLGDLAYIVVNNSHKLVVADRNTLKKLAVIEGETIANPRYFQAEGQTGYLSNWGDPFDPSDDFIAVIDLGSNLVKETIPVGEGPERMIISGKRLFVCLQGGYNHNNKVAVIDTELQRLIEVVEVGDVPNSIASDNNGKLWVLCGGKPAWTGEETGGALFRIDPVNLGREEFLFAGTEHPGLLSTDAGRLYYSLNGKTYGMDPAAGAVPREALPGLDGFFYAMRVKGGNLYGTDAGDFASEGSLQVWNVASGSLLETIPAGIVPGDIVIP